MAAEELVDMLRKIGFNVIVIDDDEKPEPQGCDHAWHYTEEEAHVVRVCQLCHTVELKCVYRSLLNMSEEMIRQDEGEQSAAHRQSEDSGKPGTD